MSELVIPVKPGQEVYDITEFINGEERAEILFERLDYFGVYSKAGEIIIETPDGVDYRLADFGTRVFTDLKKAEFIAEEWRQFHVSTTDVRLISDEEVERMRERLIKSGVLKSRIGNRG